MDFIFIYIYIRMYVYLYNELKSRVNNQLHDLCAYLKFSRINHSYGLKDKLHVRPTILYFFEHGTEDFFVHINIAN